MKVLLISANTERIPYYIYPLGLDYVAGAISEKHDVRIADINITNTLETLPDTINEFNPAVIGISLRNIDNTDPNKTKSYLGRYRDMVKTIRENSSAKIILGGSGFTIFPGKIMEALEADYGIIAEGERLVQLLETIESGGDAEGMPGVITRTSVETLPSPMDKPFTRTFNSSSQHVGFYIKKGGMLNLQTKRGCSFNCIYCTYPHIEGKELRLIPPEEVANTAYDLQKAGAKYFFITDSVFNSSYEHSAEVALALKKKGVSIPWGAFFAPTVPPDNYYAILKDAGMVHVEFGTEALSNTMLSSYRKPFNTADVITAHNSANSAGLHVAHYFLLGGPGENAGTIDETLRNVAKLEKTVIFIFSGIRIYPHTELYDISIKEGQISQADDLLEPVFYSSASIGTEEIMSLVEKAATGKENWFYGHGANITARLVSRMHKQGHTGPLWEHMIK